MKTDVASAAGSKERLSGQTRQRMELHTAMNVEQTRNESPHFTGAGKQRGGQLRNQGVSLSFAD
jgi:hypothetical protein